VKSNNAKIQFDPNLVIKAKTPNIKDLILDGSFDRSLKDRSPLWKDFDDRNLSHPNFVFKIK